MAYVTALNEGNADHIAAWVTEDFHNEHTSVLGTSVRGRDAYRERLAGFLARFTELRYDVEDVIVEGDRAAVAYAMRCRWVADDGRGAPVFIRGMFRFRVAEGAVAHRVDYWDSAEFERQVAAAGAS